MKPLATRTAALKQSDIRAITALTREVGGINLGQGICDMPTPAPVKEAACRAIAGDRSTYTGYAGIRRLREAILHKAQTYNRLPATSDAEVLVSAGSTGAFVTAIHALLDPGDEVLLFEPFYGYHRNLLTLIGACPRVVPMQAPDWRIDFDAVRAAITPRTRAVLVCTPSNPSGKVWTRDELAALLAILQEHDLYALTDEIYEYMLYDGREHVSLASLPGAYERTVTISGFSKTYNMTGWRLGYAVGPAPLLEKMGLINDLLYICAPTPLQYGVTAAFEMDAAYFAEMQAAYATKRRMLCETLERIGFGVSWPQGAYYVLTDVRPLRGRVPGFEDARTACETLIRRAHVAAVPGPSFFQHPEDGEPYLRFCFAKEQPVLEQACRQLSEAFGGRA
ncbi:aspartate aminotransferase [Rhodothermaceae bacterium RA]|nr:aspartate aminotransferase [Rhodothermaceae bacterium RA]